MIDKFIKKILLLPSFFLLILIFLIPIKVEAISGACSDHIGVNCSASQANGHAICNDGWPNSSVLYQDMDECQLSATDIEHNMIMDLMGEKRLFSPIYQQADYNSVYEDCMANKYLNSRFIDKINNCQSYAMGQSSFSNSEILCPENSKLEYFYTSINPQKYCVCYEGYYNYADKNGKEAKCEKGERPLTLEERFWGNANFINKQDNQPIEPAEKNPIQEPITVPIDQIKPAETESVPEQEVVTTNEIEPTEENLVPEPADVNAEKTEDIKPQPILTNSSPAVSENNDNRGGIELAVVFMLGIFGLVFYLAYSLRKY